MARSIPTLVDKIDLRTRHSLIKLFESDLDRVRSSFKDVWSLELDIDLLAAKLYLYGLAFVSPNEADDDNMQIESPPFAARDLLQRGLSTAVRLLYTFRHLPLSDSPHHGAQVPNSEGLGTDDYIHQLGFYPKHFFRLAGFAVYFLLWFLAVDLEASDTDKELARNYVSAAHRLFLSFPNSPEHIRAAHSFEILGRIPNTTGKTPKLRINSRLGASFMYDAMYNAVFYREGARAGEDSRITELRRIAEVLRERAHLEEAARGHGAESEKTENPDVDIGDMDVRETRQQLSWQQAGQYEEEIQNSVEDAFDPANTYNAFGGTPADCQIPWGVWDNSIYDTLNMDLDMTQAPYIDAAFRSQGR